MAPLNSRMPALDWMRGLVMVLMVTDHASMAFNAHRAGLESVHFDHFERPELFDFLCRWLSHLCAPTFVFLAGVSLAISIQRKVARGAAAKSIDRDLLVRGLVICSVEVVVISWMYDFLLLQVMYAIGISMIAMILLRRLPTGVLFGLGVLMLAGYELVFQGHSMFPMEPVSVGAIANALLVSGARFPAPWAPLDTWDPVVAVYPLLPWLAMLIVGWCFGRRLVAWENSGDRDRRAVRLLLACGLGGLAVFVLVRGLNGYGNLDLLRLDGSLLEWLRASKYPPSLSFAALELGLMSLLLAGFFRIQSLRGGNYRANGPLLVFGQTAFFFYVVHMPALHLAARLLGMFEQGGLLEAAVASVCMLLVLYPICRAYRNFKRSHPQSVFRYL